jgi:hypothetical protein
MPVFDTPVPISLHVDLGVGDLHITASDRPDTLVDVRPSDRTRKADVALAEQTQVEFTRGSLVIRTPKGRYSFWGGRESVAVTVELPSGSHLSGKTGVGRVETAGCLGGCRYKVGAGDIQVECGGAPVELKTGSGDISLGWADGPAAITTGTGAVRIGSVDGPVTVKNSNGDTWIGEVTGDLQVHSANGDIVVESSQSTLQAQTAHGDIRVRDVGRGVVVAQTAAGSIDIGVRYGVPAWLDLSTRYGDVRNDLGATDRPVPGEPAVDVRARTSYGDVTVRRSFAAVDADSEDGGPDAGPGGGGPAGAGAGESGAGPHGDGPLPGQ